MLWRWLQDWRERRSTLNELRQLRRADEAAIMDQNLNPITQARTAMERGHDETAASLWEDALQRLPDFIYQSDDSLPILLGLKRFDEAEALMQEGRRRLPRDRRWLTGLALVAEKRGDYPEAILRWRAAQAGSKSNVGNTEALLHEGICLRAAGQLDAAETVFAAVLRREPDEMVAWVERAKLSDDRRDWVESEARWRALAEHFNNSIAIPGQAQALMELGRLDEAESMLAHTFLVFPGDLAIATMRAHVAERRGDLAAASERWAEVLHIAPYFQPGYSGRAHCLFNAERHTEADAVLREAIVRFPDEHWPLLVFANFAQRRQDWQEAAARWEAFRVQFPDREEGYTSGRDSLNAAGRHAEAIALRREQ